MLWLLIVIQLGTSTSFQTFANQRECENTREYVLSTQNRLDVTAVCCPIQGGVR